MDLASDVYDLDDLDAIICPPPDAVPTREGIGGNPAVAPAAAPAAAIDAAETPAAPSRADTPPAAPDSTADAALERPAGAERSRAYLVVDSGRRVDVPVQDVVIVGREDMRSGIRPDVDLTLDGASAAGVSRRHCRLLRQPDGWHIEDLMSTNFTVLNGKPLSAHSPARLRPGDDLRLGKLRLTFHEA